MPTKHNSPIDLKIYLFRAYLASMESLLKDEAEKEYERTAKLEAEVQDYHRQIEEVETQLENRTEEEIDAANEKALREYENSWIDGFYRSTYDPDEYYKSPYYELEIANVYFLEQQFELEITLNFPNILRRSFFVNLYSFLESTLMQKCHDLERKDVQTLLLKEIAGKGIQQAMTYFIKVQGIPFSLGESSQWEKIRHYQRLRNCIVHNEGKLDERTSERPKIESFVAKEPGLSLSDGEVVLGADFCSEAIDVIETFLVQVLRAAKC